MVDIHSAVNFEAPPFFFSLHRFLFRFLNVTGALVVAGWHGGDPLEARADYETARISFTDHGPRVMYVMDDVVLYNWKEMRDAKQSMSVPRKCEEVRSRK